MGDGAPASLNITNVVNTPAFPRKADVVLFQNTSGKLLATSFHSIFPWVAAIDRHGTVYVADYAQQAPISQFSIKAHDEKIARSVDAAKGLEKLGEFKGQKQGEYSRPDRSGVIFHIQFYDEHYIKQKLDAEIGKDESCSMRYTQIPTWIILVSENRLLMIDYKSMEMSEIKSSALDGKGITCFETCCALNRHLFAFGGSDGIVRVYDYMQQKVVKKLNGNSKSVSAIASFLRGPTIYLAVAYSDGSLIIWEVDKESQVVVFPKNYLHENSGITQISYDSIYRQLVTVSSDRTMTSWDITFPILTNISNINLQRYRLNVKRNFVSWQHFVHTSLSQGTFIGWEKPTKIFCANVHDKNPIDIADLTQLISLPGKKFKMYHMSVHPQFPCLISCATNQGIIVLGFEMECMPSVGIRTDDVDQVSVLHYDRQSIHFSKMDHQNAFRKNDRLVGQTRLVQSIHVSAPSLALSFDSKYMSILWWSTREYKIYNIKTTPVKLIDEGCAMSIVWSSRSNSYATLVPNNVVSKARKGTISNAASLNPNMVIMRSIDENTIKTTIALTLPGNPIMVGSGPLLSVGCEVVSPSTGQLESVLTFFSWEGSKKLTETELPSANTVIWDQTNTLCLLIYSNFIAVFSTTPVFRLICKAPIPATGGLWFHKTLFLVTAEEIICAFPSQGKLDFTVLASSTSRLTERPNPLRKTTSDVVPVPRPCGPISFISVLGDHLFCVDRYMYTHSIPVTSPVLKAKILAQSGNGDGSLLWASQTQQETHDQIAAFLDARGFGLQALRLPGLSTWTRFHLRVRTNLLQDALESLRSLSLVADKEIPDLKLDAPLDYWTQPADLNYGHILNRSFFLAQYTERIYQMKGIDAAIPHGISCLQLAAKLEPKMNLELISFLHRNERMAELNALRDELLKNKNYDLCKMAAFALGDQRTVLLCLVQEEQYALAGAYASKHNTALTSQLEDKLRKQLGIY